MVRMVRVGAADLERGEHLALLFAVDERVVVLHGDEGREPVLDRVRCVWAWIVSGCVCARSLRSDVLCMALTVGGVS